MKTVKEITRTEMQQLLSDYCHHAHVQIPVGLYRDKQYTDNQGNWVKEELKTVLNNGMVYNPFYSKQIGTQLNNKLDAEKAMKFINEKCEIYSSVFNHISGTYVILD